MSSLAMPEPDQGVVSRRADIVGRLREIVPGEGVIADPDAMRPYETAGLTAYRQMTFAVVLPDINVQVTRRPRY